MMLKQLIVINLPLLKLFHAIIYWTYSEYTEPSWQPPMLGINILLFHTA